MPHNPTEAPSEMAFGTPDPRVYTRPTSYTVTCFREPTIDSHVFDIPVDETAPGRWAVRRGKRCLSVFDTWEWEPIPSERDDDWLAAHRFDLRLALEMAQRVAPDVTVNGHRAADEATRGSEVSR